MAFFRKLPIVIEAMQYLGTPWPNARTIDYILDFDDWLEKNQGDRKCRYVGANLIIPTLEGDHTAIPTD
jgi:hypothetical protein